MNAVLRIKLKEYAPVHRRRCISASAGNDKIKTAVIMRAPLLSDFYKKRMYWFTSVSTYLFLSIPL